MHSIQSISLAFIALLATTKAQVSLDDGGTFGGCPGGCCIPVCNFIVGDQDSLGAFGTVDFAGTCKQNFDMKNGGTQDLDDDYQATWVYEQNGPGSVAIDLFRKSDKIYNRFEVSNCQLASIGGTQCAPADGGCDLKLILTEAQG